MMPSLAALWPPSLTTVSGCPLGALWVPSLSTVSYPEAKLPQQLEGQRPPWHIPAHPCSHRDSHRDSHRGRHRDRQR
jgi:hypothetical protein